MSFALELEQVNRFRYRHIDERVDAKRACVALVARTAPGRRIEGFGSGFFYEKNGWPFFITAKHVLDDVNTAIQRGQLPFLLARGRKGFLKLTGLEFFALDDLDLAVAPLWRIPSPSYAHVDFFTEHEVATPSAKEYLAFTGFPARRNKTYTDQEIKPEQRILTLTSIAAELADPFLILPIERKGMHDSELRSMNIDFRDGLPGMSGGPVFSVRGTLDMPTLRLCGIGLAWHPESSTLKVLRMDLVDAWLENFLDW